MVDELPTSTGDPDFWTINGMFQYIHSSSYFDVLWYRDHYITNPNNALLQRNSLQITICLHCVILHKIGPI